MKCSSALHIPLYFINYSQNNKPLISIFQWISDFFFVITRIIYIFFKLPNEKIQRRPVGIDKLGGAKWGHILGGGKLKKIQLLKIIMNSYNFELWKLLSVAFYFNSNEYWFKNRTLILNWLNGLHNCMYFY